MSPLTTIPQLLLWLRRDHRAHSTWRVMLVATFIEGGWSMRGEYGAACFPTVVALTTPPIWARNRTADGRRRQAFSRPKQTAHVQGRNKAHESHHLGGACRHDRVIRCTDFSPRCRRALSDRPHRRNDRRIRVDGRRDRQRRADGGRQDQRLGRRAWPPAQARSAQRRRVGDSLGAIVREAHRRRSDRDRRLPRHRPGHCAARRSGTSSRPLASSTTAASPSTPKGRTVRRTPGCSTSGSTPSPGARRSANTR